MSTALRSLLSACVFGIVGAVAMLLTAQTAILLGDDQGSTAPAGYVWLFAVLWILLGTPTVALAWRLSGDEL